MPEFKAYGARRADDYKNVSSLAFASAKSYGARRVPLSPLATEAQNLFWNLIFCVTILLPF